MSPKTLAQASVLILVLVAFLAVPSSAQAGGTCGSTYIIQWGDTLETIAWRCGTTVSALYAANPGISGYLYAGQSLRIPGGTPPTGSNGTYIVQVGDTFSEIAIRFGVSVSNLWVANPGIQNINLLYVGQAILIPSSSGISIVTVSTETPTSLSYGTVPAGTPYGKVALSNKSKTQVYVSLQGTTRDGFHVINEYPVGGTLEAKVPAGWYTYVAWVGGQKFVGQFNLGGGLNVTLTFFKDKVEVE